MTRPNTLYFETDINGYVLRDYPAKFDLASIPEYNGQRLDLGVNPEFGRWGLMTRVAGYIAEHEQRKASARNYEEYPDNAGGDVDWVRWGSEPILWLNPVDRHLVKHGAIGPTAARYYGGGGGTESSSGVSSTAQPATANAGETATASPAPQPVGDDDKWYERVLEIARGVAFDAGTGRSSPAPQPPAVKVGDRVLVYVDGMGRVAYAHEITPDGRVMVSAYSQSKGEEFWFLADTVLEVLPPRTDGANA